MRKRGSRLVASILSRIPLGFRVLCRQFMMRVVDLEALSIEADVAGYLGQFAGVAIMMSAVHSVIAWTYFAPMTIEVRIAFQCHFEQYLIATMMLVVGTFAVVSWDAAFPDRRDVMVLSPLPVSTRSILLAKLAASGTLLGIAILALNGLCGLAWPFVLGISGGFVNGFLRTLAAYWFTMIAASAFLYGSVLTIQGLTALMLPRKLFLRVSAILQVAALALILSVYFLQGTITSLAALAAPQNHSLLASSPSFWFFALFNQLRGTLPPNLAWLASRAWAALGIAVTGAVGSLLLCYVRTMRKTVEEPDLVPGARSSQWGLPFGSRLQTAILEFSIRSLLRSRQHRVVLAFYLGVGFAIALLCIKHEGSLIAHPRTLSAGFLVATFAMMSFAVIGLRSVYALPISLTANWVLRTTQLTSSDHYIAAARRSLLLFAAVPVWLISALIALTYRPFSQAAEHLVILSLLGLILADLNLLGFYKVPFTCSYLPGKSNIQFSFWVFLIVFVPLTLLGATRELRALAHPFQFACIVAALAVVAAGLRAINRHRSKSAVLYFEEPPEEVITTLRLMSLPPPATTSAPRS
jgi:hypothetical protein